MKKYFKLIMAAALMLLLFSFTAGAQVFQSRSFLNVQVAVCTNALAPAGAGLTNLITARNAGDGFTNVTGTTFTNLNARYVVNTTSAQSNITASAVNIFKDVPLWTLKNGDGAWSQNVSNANASAWDIAARSYANVAVKWSAQSAANSAVTFVLTPIYDGVNEATTAAEEWTFSFTAVASTTSTFATNAPLWRWPGASKLRVRRITNADADASSAVAISSLSLNGFVP